MVLSSQIKDETIRQMIPEDVIVEITEGKDYTIRNI